ncbi:MAG TPA: HAD family acid phosphatase [Gemmatimonadaceae bacterium]|jgi:5'-nucleotidase (lipoprotein e(P4) family)
MKSRQSTPGFLLVLACVGTLACTPAPRVAPIPVTSTATAATPNDVKWSRVSAEHRAIYIETYRAAANQLTTLVAGRPSGSWGVILDADETVLDNSEYEVGRIPFGGSFDARIWTAWVMEGRAPALPGAVAFTTRVHQLGGKVVIVTNRDDAECPITRINLEHASVHADLVLCKTTTDDKNPRFDAVQNGTAAAGFAAISVVEWVGDNIQDFPRLTQAIRSESEAGFSRFGESFFALPNAMYGSWQANPFE